MFSLVFRALGGDDMVHRTLGRLPGGVNGAVLAVMVAMFLLGFVMDERCGLRGAWRGGGNADA